MGAGRGGGDKRQTDEQDRWGCDSIKNYFSFGGGAPAEFRIPALPHCQAGRAPRAPRVTAKWWRWSAVAEHRLALFKESRHPLDRVRGLRGEGVEVGFDREAFLQRDCQTAMNGVAGETQGGQAVAGHLAREALAGIEQIAVDEAVDEADPLGLFGLDGASGQDHLERARLAD